MSSSPGLRGTSYPGSGGRESINPVRVAPRPAFTAPGRNPVGVITVSLTRPRVARSSQPWVRITHLGFETESLRDSHAPPRRPAMRVSSTASRTHSKRFASLDTGTHVGTLNTSVAHQPLLCATGRGMHCAVHVPNAAEGALRSRIVDNIGSRQSTTRNRNQTVTWVDGCCLMSNCIMETFVGNFYRVNHSNAALFDKSFR